MISSVSGITSLNHGIPIKNASSNACSQQKTFHGLLPKTFGLKPANILTQLNSNDKKKYAYLVDYLKDFPVSYNSSNTPAKKQLDILLKNGRLLSKSKNDRSTTLDNLYDIATKEREYGLDSKRLLGDTLDILSNPRIITQTFGDIPDIEKQKILSELPDNENVKNNPSLMDVTASGTCAAASNEVNLADKYPAEFARWVSKL